MEDKKLWNLREDKEKFLSKRGTRKRKKSQDKQKVQRKSRKISDDSKSNSLNLVKNSGSVKAKLKLHLFSKNSPFLRKKEVKNIYET